MSLQRDIRRKNLEIIANNHMVAKKYLKRNLTEDELRKVYTFPLNEKFDPIKIFGCQEKDQPKTEEISYIYRRRYKE